MYIFNPFWPSHHLPNYKYMSRVLPRQPSLVETNERDQIYEHIHLENY